MSICKNLFHILPAGSSMKKLNSKPFGFLEGPAWDKKRDTLYFSDVSARKTYRMTASGEFGVLRTDTFYGNGQALGSNGNLLICEMNKGMIIEVSTDTGEVLRVVAEGYNGKSFNATNDIVVSRKGGIYFTDPDFGHGPKTQDKEATYYLAPDGEIKRVAQDSTKPNGLALSSDGKLLYIDDTASVTVWVYSINEDGTLSKGKKFCELVPPKSDKVKEPMQAAGLADGMAIDIEGNLYVATFTGIQVFNNLGECLGCISMPGDESPANCAFGGKDMKTLYITAQTSLYSIDLQVPGTDLL